MASHRPLLDDLELELVQRVDGDQDMLLERTSVPGLDGDFLETRGRRATRITLTGVVAGELARDSLDKVRKKFRRAEPMAFVSDIATATRVDKVLVEEFGVRELAGKPERFEYALTLREVLEAEPPPIDPIPVPPVTLKTTLEVEVIVEGEPDFDFSTVTVKVVDATAATPDRTLTQRTGNVWREDPMPAGDFKAQATAEDMSGESPVHVQDGVDPNRVTVQLRRGARVGNGFVVHYRFDKAFVEPCMREVLQEVIARVQHGPAEEKLLIVGHTDRVGSDEYNQSLSERRARGVYAFLTFGLDPDRAFREWDQLRRPQAGALPTLQDGWGARQYQYMLQDLGFYNGRVDGIHGDQTTAAVRRFQQAQGLPPAGFVDDATWEALIRAYLGRSRFTVPKEKLLANCGAEELKWLGCGEEDPVIDTGAAERRNRRTELIFARVTALSCRVPRPVTFDLPAPGFVASDWCLGDRTGPRACFLRRTNGRNSDPNAILVEPVSAARVTVTLRLRFEDGSPAADMPFVLIAPDGEFMNGEQRAGASRGEPIEGRTGPDGTFTYDAPRGVGIFTLEVQAGVVARLAGAPPGSGKGNVVCKRIAQDGDLFDVILTARPQALEFVDASDVDRTLDRVVFGQPFLIRADIPGETRDEVVVELASYLIRRTP